MLIVAVDTSGRKGSIALCRGDRDSFEVLQLTSLEGGTYSAQLMPRIAEALQQNNLDKTTSGRLCGRLRTGFVYGLASWTCDGEGSVRSAAEAAGNRFHAGSRRADPWTCRPNRDGSVGCRTRRSLCRRVSSISRHAPAWFANTLRSWMHSPRKPPVLAANLLTPDPKVAEALQAANADVRLVPAVHADEIGRIGIRKLLAGETADPATIDVNYIRRSDAEIFSAPKH